MSSIKTSQGEKKIRRGRPVTTGKSPMVFCRLPAAEITAFDKWARAKSWSRSQAMRALIRDAIYAK